MILWRVSNYRTLDGTGGLYVSGRWHTRGHPVVYCSQNPSTSLLETLVHLEIEAEDRPENFQVLKIEGPDTAIGTLSLESIEPASLPKDWATDTTATQAIGDRWLTEKRTLLLQVPSVLVPETWNVLVNPLHPEANLLKITRVYEHAFDVRLF